MKQAYMYTRVSTQVQTEKFGLDVQKEEIEKYCSQNEIEIIGQYSDEGITGKIIERDGLQQMLSDVESNNVKYVVVLNCSRLWRSDIAGGLIRYNLSKLESDIISVQEPSYSLYTNDPSDYLINSIMQALASYDRMSLNKKLASSRRVKAKQGSKPCGSLPFGYKWDNAKVVVDYNNNIIVQDIFTQYSIMHSLSDLQTYCNSHNYKTTNGKDFSKQSLSNILKNDFYIGIVTHANVKSQGTHETFISKELFNQVNQILGGKNVQ